MNRVTTKRNIKLPRDKCEQRKQTNTANRVTTKKSMKLPKDKHERRKIIIQ